MQYGKESNKTSLVLLLCSAVLATIGVAVNPDENQWTFAAQAILAVSSLLPLLVVSGRRQDKKNQKASDQKGDPQLSENENSEQGKKSRKWKAKKSGNKKRNRKNRQRIKPTKSCRKTSVQK